MPTLFTYSTQQPLVVNPHWAALANAAQPWKLWAAFFNNDPAASARVAPILAHYDYVIFSDNQPFLVPEQPCVQSLADGGSFQIFKLIHGVACHPAH